MRDEGGKKDEKRETNSIRDEKISGSKESISFLEDVSDDLLFCGLFIGVSLGFVLSVGVVAEVRERSGERTSNLRVGSLSSMRPTSSPISPGLQGIQRPEELRRGDSVSGSKRMSLTG